MKIFIYADPHWSRTSSIVRGRGEKYSVRLENLIKSINWVENTAVSVGADAILCLGDFFDSVNISAEEMTALTEVKWANLRHLFLVGNHETNSVDNQNNLANLFSLIDNSCVIAKPEKFAQTNCELCFLPYIHPSEQKTITEYFGAKQSGLKRYIFSHNDIKGIQYGQFVSQSGLEIDDIRDNCDMLINGHLHNHHKIFNIVNLGNLTGQNFSEDGEKYGHYAMILDTDNDTAEYVENPFAIKFYKVNANSVQDVERCVSGNSVITVSCSESISADINEALKSSDVIAYKVSTVYERAEKKKMDEEKTIRCVDHIDAFRKFVNETIGNSEVIAEELLRVTK